MQPDSTDTVERELMQLEDRLVRQYANDHPLMAMVIREYLADAHARFTQAGVGPRLLRLVEGAVVARLHLQAPI